MHTLVEKYTWFNNVLLVDSISIVLLFESVDIVSQDKTVWYSTCLLKSVVLVAISFLSKSESQNWFTLWRTEFWNPHAKIELKEISFD